MKADHIITLLKTLGSKNFKTYNKWVSCDCPLSRWTHKGGTDKKPSFNVSISNEGSSIYYCYTCSDKYRPLTQLLHFYWNASGEYPEEAAKILSKY
ncbi:MAG: hypothetical protein ACP5RW_09890 [bacterium]